MRLGALACAVGCLSAVASTSAAHASPIYTGLGASGNVIHYMLPSGSGPTSDSGGASPAVSDKLQYHGGLTETTSKNFLIFWEPGAPWNSLYKVSPNYNSLITRFFNDIGGTGLYGVASQYYKIVSGVKTFISNSATLGGVYVDTDPYYKPVLTDGDIQAEVYKAIGLANAAAGNNAWDPSLGTNEYFVFTAANELICASVECSNVIFCAYHSSVGSVAYAAMPYTTTLPVGCNTPTSPNSDIAADSTINVASHELMETVTDTDVGNVADIAWQGPNGGSDEIGDKCNFVFGPTNASGADLTANGHGYIVQEEFSNSIDGCSMS